jgi:hypothetical protein
MTVLIGGARTDGTLLGKFRRYPLHEIMITDEY